MRTRDLCNLIVASSFLVMGSFSFALADEPMSFTNDCAGNSAASCVIVARGVIQPDTATRFHAFLKDEFSDGNIVLFDSQGGDLAAGMELGRVIREAQFETRVGRWEIDGVFGEVVDDTECSSACAYAFLGGTIRQVPEGNRLGFHQFYLDASMVPVQVAGSALVQVMAETQRLSGDIVFYLIEMGVDARLFSLGSQTEQAGMIYPEPQKMLDFDLITPDGFGAFFLEPFRNGILAASRRTGPTRLYDEMTQLTALCRGGVGSLLVSANGWMEDVGPATVYLSDGSFFSIGRDRITTRGESAVEVTLAAAESAAFAKADGVEISVGRSQASGGEIKGGINLSAMDRNMIAAAFRHCI
ncbi:MAG: hypothetical protein JJU07_12405 [Natronohydrobacter sp.]|nr:hypothetical protein [Natronohydrobacter sp.]